jgi:hypothetical protein
MDTMQWVWCQKKSKFKLSEVKVGDKIAIFFSPADMARGTIVNG